MRVFITGATGYVGSAVASALANGGHELTALVRPESDSRHLRDRGVVIVAGDLASLPSLRDTLAEFDVIVHAASSAKDQAANDKIAIDVFTSVDAFVVYTSGVWVLGRGEADEHSPTRPLAIVAWRAAHEQQVLATGRGAVVRPGCVYGGKQSMLGQWFAAANQKQPLQIVGDGTNRWALVDIHDAAECYAHVVEQTATGIFHAVDDSHDSLLACARAVAPKARIEHIPADAARATMGPFVDALLVDQVVSSEETRNTLGWKPSRTFIGSIDEQWREWKLRGSGL